MNMRAAMCLVICSIASAGALGSNADLEQESARVSLVLDQFEDFWETEDMEILSRIMAHDEDLVAFGTDPGEHFVGWDSLRNSIQGMLASLNDARLQSSERVVKFNDDRSFAWFSELVDWSMLIDGKPVEQHCRFTGVMEKRNGNWLIVQFHNSVPAT